MRLEFIRMLPDNVPVKAREALDTLGRLAGQAVKEGRTVLLAKRSMTLGTQGSLRPWNNT